MSEPIATGEMRRKILLGAVIYGIFFGLMPPYIFTIVLVATWGGGPQMPEEPTFRAIYFVRLALGNAAGLLVGASLTVAAVNIGLRLAGKATYLRGILGGLVLGTVAGGLIAASTPLFLLISSTDTAWAWSMVQRALMCGAIMGMINGMMAGVVIMYFIKRSRA